MTKELAKKAFSEAEKSLREKQVDEVKQIVLKTLEKIETLKKEKEKAQETVKDIEEKIKVLKMDIDDLKEGRLDRIEERQTKDEKAKETSVVIIIKEREVVREYPYWHWPWRIYWTMPTIQPIQPDYTLTTSYDTTTSVSPDSGSGYLTCSTAKWATAGTYCLSDGTTINIR